MNQRDSLKFSTYFDLRDFELGICVVFPNVCGDFTSKFWQVIGPGIGKDKSAGDGLSPKSFRTARNDPTPALAMRSRLGSAASLMTAPAALVP